MINFKSENWFLQYLSYRKAHPIEVDTFSLPSLGIEKRELERFESLKHPWYGLLQSSGLIYGFPVHYPFQPIPEVKLLRRDLAKLMLVDLILFTVLIRFKEKDINYETQVDKAGELIRAYYRGISIVDREGEEPSIENILMDRVAFRKSYFDLRKSGINGHLFWDWYFFREYLKAEEENREIDKQWFEQLFLQKKEMKKLSLHLITAAIHCDDKVTKGEKVFMEHFKRSSRFLNKNEKGQLARVFKEGIDIDLVRIPELTWTARRYLLDISLLAIYADKMIEAREEMYLKKLTKKLGLEEEDLIESKISLGVFLFQYGRKLHFYNQKNNGMSLITQAIVENTFKLTKATRLEYGETVEMANTFGVLLKHQLKIGKDNRIPSEEEIASALDQLKDIPKFLPFLSIMFIPVPGITEAYILLACSIERLSGNTIRLLPSNFSRMVKKK